MRSPLGSVPTTEHGNQVGPVKHESFRQTPNYFSFKPHHLPQRVGVVNPQPVIRCAQEAGWVRVGLYEVGLLWHVNYDLKTELVIFYLLIKIHCVKKRGFVLLLVWIKLVDTKFSYVDMLNWSFNIGFCSLCLNFF